MFIRSARVKAPPIVAALTADALPFVPLMQAALSADAVLPFPTAIERDPDAVA
jgi:hypothetical protein